MFSAIRNFSEVSDAREKTLRLGPTTPSRGGYDTIPWVSLTDACESSAEIASVCPNEYTSGIVLSCVGREHRRPKRDAEKSAAVAIPLGHLGAIRS
jgi:hypothetical protein